MTPSMAKVERTRRRVKRTNDQARDLRLAIINAEVQL